jgi:serine/threonine-protein kinase PRP4
VLGKGMFAIVVRARVLDGEPGKEVAIKITRCQESMWVLVCMVVGAGG